MKASKEKKPVQGLLFDIIIILLVFGSMGAGFFYTFKPKEVITSQVEYKVIFDFVDKNIASNITIGEDFLSDNGESMGRISTALNENKIIQTLNKTSDLGEYVSHISSEYNTVKATIYVNAIYDNGFYSIGDQPLRAGEQIVLRLPDFYGVATITAVSVKEVD
ncbi:MAG: hypothetical protein A2Y15_07920 [Clostridiales bacterium GWF2_36_10]|nr:MAG: hypothetical protein A2Y15_07920 [Clostridiales bacterium GWF2_36_10]HAN20272.1 hypothetical protein [Clostridiales bacterium]